MNRGESRWGRRVSAVLLATLLLPLVGRGSPKEPSCRKVHGRFTLRVVAGADCPSPVGICASGMYLGVIQGTASFVGSSVTPTADTPVTSVVLLTGDNVIQTKDGTLRTKDAIVSKGSGAGEFSEVDEIVGGTGALAGATGTLTATGTLSGTVGEGVYSGVLCTP